MAGNPVLQLSTAAGMGAAALDFVRADERLQKQFRNFLAARSGGPDADSMDGDFMARALEGAATACAGLSQLLAQGEAA